MGLYCYELMPFGLKNTGAIYQRLINKMFANIIGKTMEVYVDNMEAKSLKVAYDFKEVYNEVELAEMYF